jgi:predicted nucleotidyltransferase component of viral defense system
MSPGRQARERLEKKLARVAREQGLDQERLRRWVSFLALCGVLERALGDGVLGNYYLKGGVAMELRFAQRARATKDLDLGMEGNRADRLQTLAEALRLGFDEFTFRLKTQKKEMEIADTVRVEVAVQYRTRSWQTIEVDLGPAKPTQIDLVEPRIQGLIELGIPVTSPVRCLGLAEQVAQKIHACTAPRAIGRARDVLDILLIDLLGQLDYARTAEATRLVFEERATHPFPAEFAVPAAWRPELDALAVELGFPLTDSFSLEKRFLEIISRLGDAGRPNG